jgi:predicted regulator of Ras-like GTPase activity (Roadblock/LC7/MglB family)
MSDTPEKKPIDENDMLRYKRLVFYSEEVDRINENLSDFLDSTQAKAALVVDTEGHLVTKMGYTKSIDTESLSALIAGSFASTREVAKILGEEEFKEIYHQGKNDSIYVCLVRDRSMIVVVFDNRTTIGMVKFYADSVAGRIGLVIDETYAKMESGEGGGEGEFLEEDFSESMKNKLDDLFGL